MLPQEPPGLVLTNVAASGSAARELSSPGGLAIKGSGVVQPRSVTAQQQHEG